MVKEEGAGFTPPLRPALAVGFQERHGHVLALNLPRPIGGVAKVRERRGLARNRRIQPLVTQRVNEPSFAGPQRFDTAAVAAAFAAFDSDRHARRTFAV